MFWAVGSGVFCERWHLWRSSDVDGTGVWVYQDCMRSRCDVNDLPSICIACNYMKLELSLVFFCNTFCACIRRANNIGVGLVCQATFWLRWSRPPFIFKFLNIEHHHDELPAASPSYLARTPAMKRSRLRLFGDGHRYSLISNQHGTSEAKPWRRKHSALFIVLVALAGFAVVMISRYAC